MIEWDKKETEAINEMFAGNWHKEANNQNAQIYFQMSIDETGKIRVAILKASKAILSDQLRSVADRLQNINDTGHNEFKFDLN